ncbi:MAG: hypothetical protein ACERKD_21630 [Prolixibacteraceae bacterium]
MMIFHANLNYAYLPEHRYEFVIRKSYELIFDTMRNNFPGTKYVFEASGFTIEQIALKTPDVLEKLKLAISNGECEFMGSPYAHPMLPNFPKKDGIRSLGFSNEIYSKYLGFQPISFWNPECGWRSYVPEIIAESGYKNLVGDFEAYSRSLDNNSKPLRPEIYEKEHSDDPSFYSFDFKYDLPGTERAIHFPFNKVQSLEDDALKVFLRSDRIAQFGVRYFMGMEGYTFEKYLNLIKKYSAQNEGEEEGALVIFADDAEYIGTNGWFRLKYENKPDNVFEHTPQSKEKLIELVTECLKIGSFTTFADSCSTLPCMSESISFDDDSAWHGARASTWANTPMAKLLRPWQNLIREELQQSKRLDYNLKNKIWYHLTNSYNSDGQWPPTLPNAPHIIHPFNYKYCFDNLLIADQLLGGNFISKLENSPVETLKAILIPQGMLIKKKAKELAMFSNNEDALLALKLLDTCLDFTAIETSKSKILYPSEYESRANMLVEARRLVGGVEIE